MSRPLPNDANSTSPPPDGRRAAGKWWRLPMLLALLLAVILLGKSAGLRQTVFTGQPGSNDSTAGLPPVAPSGQTVSLAIRFADGPERHDYVAWQDGMTVEDLLGAASHLPKGIQFAQQGSGESALLTEINGVANEGGSARNWTYSVNGQEADRSFAVYKLQPGDHVLWTFAAKQ
jgi:hypothetical protein